MQLFHAILSPPFVQHRNVSAEGSSALCYRLPGHLGAPVTIRVKASHRVPCSAQRRAVRRAEWQNENLKAGPQIL